MFAVCSRGRVPHRSRHRRGHSRHSLGALPVVPGHEWSGDRRCGRGRSRPVSSRAQRVVCEGNIGCMSCPRCRAGDTHLCQSYDAVGFTRGGGWGEFVVVPARILHTLPDHVSFEAGRARGAWARSSLKALERAPDRAGRDCRESSGSARWALSPSGSPASAHRQRSSPTACATKSWSWPSSLGADAVVNVASRTRRPRRSALVRRRSRRRRGDGRGRSPPLELSTRTRRARVGASSLSGSRVTDQELHAPRRPDRAPRSLRATAAWATRRRRGRAWSSSLRERLVELDPIVTHRFPLERFEEAFALMDDRRGVVAKIVLEHAA